MEEKEYQEPYRILWWGMTEAVEALDAQNYGLARALLLQAQEQAEEAFINWSGK